MGNNFIFKQTQKIKWSTQENSSSAATGSLMVQLISFASSALRSSTESSSTNLRLMSLLHQYFCTLLLLRLCLTEACKLEHKTFQQTRTVHSPVRSALIKLKTSVSTGLLLAIQSVDLSSVRLM